MFVWLNLETPERVKAETWPNSDLIPEESSSRPLTMARVNWPFRSRIVDINTDNNIARLITTSTCSTPLYYTIHSNPLKSTPLHSTPLYRLLYSTLLWSTPLLFTPLHSTLLSTSLYWVRYSTLLYSILLNSILHRVLYSILLYSTLLYSTLLYFTLLCSTLFYTSLINCILLYSILLYFTFLHFNLALLYFTLLNFTGLYRKLLRLQGLKHLGTSENLAGEEDYYIWGEGQFFKRHLRKGCYIYPFF